MIVVIDGPAGSGKSSTARAVAHELNIQYLDSGALYRAATYLFLKNVHSLPMFFESLYSAQLKFEFNDEFTRAQFKNLVEPFLRDIQGRRGLTDFSVVCDETNNTSDVIDRNEFRADIFIKPARSINFIGLTFVATRTGISFEEVVGTV